jgi:predicted Zn-dependent protease
MFEVSASLKQHFAALHSTADFWSLRHLSRRTQRLSVVKNVVSPPALEHDQGAMLCVRVAGSEAYAATSDLSLSGLQQALRHAEQLARHGARARLLDSAGAVPASQRADYLSPAHEDPLPSLAECLDLLRSESAAVPRDQRLVNWESQLDIEEVEQIYLNSAGAQLRSAQRFIYPGFEVTAYDGRDSQTRTLHGGAHGQQGGWEVVGRSGLVGSAARIADEALQLLLAPNTPSGTRDLLLMPDQMVLQIHESIGHPLEMDRILGDERNYAGTSFIKREDFGHYVYGSPLLNVSFDPQIPEQLASYAFDDDGTPAQKTLLIENGILKRPLGGELSQLRSGLGGVANSRACNWNRAPIDRMANLNVEPGEKSLDQLIAAVEDGVLMATNRSWSIDDARNKFQFGCEWGQLIKDGQLGQVVKNPNYRGISAQFWRSLSGVGDLSTRQVLGTANCGKGEPNQAVRVGHASPACLFSQVAVFGGAQ